MWIVQPLVMRTAVILLMSLLIAAAAVAQVDEGERTLRLLLHDIPAEDLSSASEDDSRADIQATVEDAAEQAADTELSPEQCRQSCVTVGTTLDAMCERHVRAEAPRSRAVCYPRVDEWRTRCMASCGE